MLLFLLLSMIADSSWVRFETKPAEVILVLGEDLSRPIAVTSGDSLLLPVGTHAYRFTHPSFGDSHGELELAPGETVTLIIDLRFNRIPIPNTKSTWFVLRSQANLFVETDDDTKIFLNGEQIGQGTASLLLPYGGPELTLELRWGPLRHTLPVDLQTHRSAYVKHHLAPHRVTYWFLSPFPGMTQLHEGRWITSAALLTASLASAAVLARSDMIYRDRRETYREIRADYRAATTFDKAEELGIQMDAAFVRYDRAAQWRNASILLLGAAYGIHWVDVAIPPKYGFRRVTVRPNPYQMVGADIRLGF